MSLIVRICSPEVPHRILSTRELRGHLGQTEQGFLTLSRVSRPWLCYAAYGDTYIIQPETCGLLANGLPFRPYDSLLLYQPITVDSEDWHLQLMATSGAAEILSHVQSLSSIPQISSASLLCMRLSLAGAWRSYPLFPEYPLTIGSNPECAVQIQVPGIEPHHCSIELIESEIYASPANGKVSVFPESPRANWLSVSGVVYLEPLGIPLEINLHAVGGDQ